MTSRITGLENGLMKTKVLALSLLLMAAKISLSIFLRLMATTLKLYLKDRKLNSPFTAETRVLLLQT